MQRSKWRRLTAVAAAMALAVSACGNGDTTEPDPDPDTTPGTEEPVDVVGRGDGKLVIASVLDQTGFLSYLSAPIVGGIELAIADINAAGGVFGEDVEWRQYNDGTDPSIAVPSVNSALAEGADVLIGAMASGITLTFTALLSANSVYTCSPSATSPRFLDDATSTTMFRTVPPDEFVSPIIADEIINDNNADNVVIVAQQNDYGAALAGLVQEDLEAAGGTVVRIDYDEEATVLDAEADQVVGANPTAVVIIGYKEAAALINSMIEKGLDPSIFYGADGIFSSELPGLVGGSADVIDGMKVIGAAGSDEFNARLAGAGVNDFLYGAQGYDCAILLALWATAEGTDDSTNWDPQTLRDLTSGGTDCDNFADCVALLEDGEDLNYNGATGALALQEGNPGGVGNIGNPTFATYAVAQYQNGGVLTAVRSTDVDLR